MKAKLVLFALLVLLAMGLRFNGAPVWYSGSPAEGLLGGGITAAERAELLKR